MLRERWEIHVYPTEKHYHCFDLQTTQTALTDKPLIVNKYHYGGMALRGRTRWLVGEDASQVYPALTFEPSRFLNERGSDRRRGNHQRAKWVALTGTVDGDSITIAVLCHPENLRSPQTARIHPTKPYFCFAPCVDGEFTIDRKHPFCARYRYLVTDSPPDAQWIDRQWESWTQK